MKFSVIKAIAVTGALLLSAPALASDESERLEAAQQLVDQTMTENFTKQMSSSVWPTIEPVVRAKNPNVNDETVRQLADSFNALMAQYLGTLMQDMVPVYAKYFTAEELRQLLAFQSTPLGKKSIEVQPKIMAEAMPRIMQGVQTLLPQINQEFTQIVRQQGLEL